MGEVSPFSHDLMAARSAGEWLSRLGIGYTTGNIFFVDSDAGTDSGTNSGSYSSPFDTIDYAIGRCTATNGDVIVVKPGHAEAVAAASGIALDVAGVSIVGIGVGSAKPTVTMGTAATATVNVTADNCLIKGLRLVNNIDSLEKFIADGAERTVVEDCEFVTSSTKEAVCFIVKTTTKDFVTVRRCKFFQPTDPAGTDGGDNTGCFYGEDVEHVLFEDCEFVGNFETAIFHNKTTAGKYWWVRNCYGRQALSGAEPFQLAAGCSGAMLGGGFITPNEAAVTEATLVGTLGDGFFILQPGAFGNDGGAGGQGGIIVATAS